MNRITITTIFICLSTLSFGQKFMIKDNDTLPYHETMEFRENGDTFYSAPCRTFEMIRGKIINQTDEQCLRQGAWTITDSSGNYRTGNYKDNKEACIWKQFDKNGKILRLTENVSFGHDTYRVKEIDYTSGQPLTITNKPFLSFYIKNLVAIMVILFTAFFSRIFINNTIYNRENGTSHSPFYIGLPFTKKYWEKARHNLKCVFTFWFFIYKPENRKLVFISNTLSAIALLIFFGSLIGLAVAVEI